MGYTCSMTKYLLAIIFACCLSIAQAHTTLNSSYPADKQVLGLITQDVNLNFAAPVVILRVELRGEAVREDLDISVNNGASENIVAKLPSNLGDGSYIMRWTALSEDGHNLSGALSFTIAAP